MKKFWMVVRAIQGSCPQRRHETLQDAKLEAERLCQKENHFFVILEATEWVGRPKQPLEWHKLED